MEKEIQEILARVDHTLLRQTAAWEEIQRICEEGMEFHTASVCIPPCYVREARAFLGDRLPVCTVIGFPNGSSTTASKVFETEDAVQNGAAEIDMVINVGMLKEGRYDDVRREIDDIKRACEGRLLKVIVETCLLTEEEKIRMCRIVSESRADFIKTSTGFGTAGATFEDVALLKAHMAPEKQIKAAGGISGFADAVKFLSLGADRLGTSRLVEQAKKEADLDGQI